MSLKTPEPAAVAAVAVGYVVLSSVCVHYCEVCALGELKAGELSVRLFSRDGLWSSFAPNSKLQVEAVGHVYEHNAIEWVENWRYTKLGTYSEEAAHMGIAMRFTPFNPVAEAAKSLCAGKADHFGLHRTFSFFRSVQ